MGGAQAQLLSAAQTSVWARLAEVERAEIDAALYTSRRVVRAWCMRRTLFLLPSRDLAVFGGGTARRALREVRWLRGKGVTDRAISAATTAVLAALDRPRTRRELASEVARSLGVPLRERKGGDGWGQSRRIPWLRVGRLSLPVSYLLHVSAADGVVCCGPPDGAEATYVRGDAWVPGWRSMPRAEAEARLLERYLASHGPATARDFVWWSGLRDSEAREAWALLGDAAASVDVEGRASWILRKDLRELERSELDGAPLRLLPYFDAFVLGQPGRDPLEDPRDARRVYRAQGWVAPVVLSGGRIAGVWEQRVTRGQLRVSVRGFSPLGPAHARELRREAGDLARFLGASTAAVSVA